MSTRPKVVILDQKLGDGRLEETILRPLSPRFLLSTLEQHEDELRRLLCDADAVLNSSVFIKADLLKDMQNCRVIANYGAGGVDENAAAKTGISVTNVQDQPSAIEPLAEHILTLVMAWDRNLFSLNLPEASGKSTNGISRSRQKGRRKTKVGICGPSQIANALARLGSALGIEVLATEKAGQNLEAGIKVVARELLFQEADFVANFCRGERGKGRRLGKREFQMMKPGSRYLHGGRPAGVDEDALFQALAEDRLSGAVLDAQYFDRGKLCARFADSRRLVFTVWPDWDDISEPESDRELAAREILRILQRGPEPFKENIPPKPSSGASGITGHEETKANGNSKSSTNGHESNPRRIVVADFLVRYLESLGVKQVFGVVGGSITPFYKFLDKSPIQDVLTKHEAGAAFMADAYARVSGQPGVCIATTGPGATNLITGVASAYADSIPMFVLTGQVSTEYFGKGASQESSFETVNIVQMYKEITRYSSMAIKGKRVPEMMRKAVTNALHGRPGPVHLSFPNDVLREEIEDSPDIWSRPRPSAGSFDREGVREAATWLLRAKRPAILVGNGCVMAEAWEEMRRLAEDLRIPVATTPKAKGTLPEDHRLSLGVFGFSGSPLAEWYLLSQQVDVLLAVGTSFNEWGTMTWKKDLMPSRALLHVNIDPRDVGRNYPATVSLCGHAKTVLTELFFEIQRQRRWYTPYQNGLFGRVTEAREKIGMVKDRAAMQSDATPIKPQRLMADLRASLPQDAIVFVDGGANRAWATHYFPVLTPRTFFSATGMASMGYGVAGAIGAKFAVPDRVVVSIVGDGGFLMNGAEVSTAVAYKKQVIWVVLNDGQHGMIYHGCRMLGYPPVSTQYPMCDIAKIAEGMGARGIQINEPGEIHHGLIQKILQSGEPTVLDVRVDPNEVPPIGGRVSSIQEGAGKALVG